MKVISNIDDILKYEPTAGVSLTIGNFDGVHLGHQDLLKDIRDKSIEDELRFVVVSFVPHPHEILKPADNFLINSYEERRSLLRNFGVDYLLEIDFNRDFSTLKPQEFLDQYIFCKIPIKKLFLGHDFAFGSNKAGDHDFMQRYCEAKSIKCILQREYKIDNHEISSSIIRKHILSGRITDANKLLGRELYISGRVVKGEGRGRQIGFPTANLAYSSRRVIPHIGVYATRTLYKKTFYNSVTNIGVKPTFSSTDEIHVETHLLDFDLNIYGEELSIFFLTHLRGEVKFNSIDELVAQIRKDVVSSQKYFRK